MNYLLSPGYRLRGWRGIPYVLLSPKGVPQQLTQKEFDILILCDGKHSLTENEPLLSFIEKGVIMSIEGELQKVQSYRFFDNAYMPKLTWEITSRCNYRCVHCFNGADASQGDCEQFSLQKGLHLIAEAESCGVQSFTITGGEPFLHPNLPVFFEEIYRRGMTVGELNTNGSYLNEEFLDKLISIGASPLIKISLDGIGFHDEMRGVCGAEQKALSSMELCLSKGFRVMAQINVNKRNLNTLLPTLDKLDKMGVTISRVIRTSESPRLLALAPDMPLSVDDFYSGVISALSQYCANVRQMNIEVWQFVFLNVKEKTFYFPALLHYKENGFKDSRVICSSARLNICVGAGGNVYPCLQCSGLLDQLGICLGNIHKTGLKKVLQDSPYLHLVSTTTKERLAHCTKCNACRYREVCCGGCPIIGMAFSKDKRDYLAPDPWRCLLFKKRYDLKCEAAIIGYKNNAPMPDALKQGEL